MVFTIQAKRNPTSSFFHKILEQPLKYFILAIYLNICSNTQTRPRLHSYIVIVAATNKAGHCHSIECSQAVLHRLRWFAVSTLALTSARRTFSRSVLSIGLLDSLFGIFSFSPFAGYCPLSLRAYVLCSISQDLRIYRRSHEKGAL